jgi:hypothetical protein
MLELGSDRILLSVDYSVRINDAGDEGIRNATDKPALTVTV